MRKKIEKNKRSAIFVSTALTVCSNLNVITTGSAAGSLISGIGIIAFAPFSKFAVVNSVAILVLIFQQKEKTTKAVAKKACFGKKI